MMQDQWWFLPYNTQMPLHDCRCVCVSIVYPISWRRLGATPLQLASWKQRVLQSVKPRHRTVWTYGYGSIPINTIFSGMNIHLPAILMFTRGTRFWHTAICEHGILDTHIYYHILTKSVDDLLMIVLWCFSHSQCHFGVSPFSDRFIVAFIWRHFGGVYVELNIPAPWSIGIWICVSSRLTGDTMGYVFRSNIGLFRWHVELPHEPHCIWVCLNMGDGP